mgnify:CR=1 FL=1
MTLLASSTLLGPARRLRARLPTWLQPLLTRQFVKFCSVGASGVVVNLGCLWLFQRLGLRSSFASAWAIEVSILSNFVVNELWTFREHRHAGSPGGRAVRFQLVSLVGAALQWLVFLAGNVGWLWLRDGGEAVATYFAGSEDAWRRYLLRPVTSPPAVGIGTYVAQLIGIGVATGWNFLANFRWTWRARHSGE